MTKKKGRSCGLAEYRKQQKALKKRPLLIFKRQLRRKRSVELNPMLLQADVKKRTIARHIRRIFLKVRSSRIEGTKARFNKKEAYLKRDLESKFQPDMCWENYGCATGCWHISFIIPPETATDKYTLNKYSRVCNLMPAWGKTSRNVKA
jgi:hypothetical protein